MTRFYWRYARRMLRVAAGRFGREERGTVMVMTIVLALPLAMFVFTTYNAGVALTHRMRAQCVADAASYSASLWHARFLNYCAYSRRQITANYAVMALCTAYQSSLKMYYNIYDAQELIITFNEDKGLLKTMMEAPYQVFKALQLFEDSETKNPVMMIRKAADIMNKMLSNSQLAMYLAACMDTKGAVMEKVVEEANRETAAGGGGAQFELDTLSYSSLLFSPSVLGPPVEQKAITLDQVEFYFDKFTKAEAFSVLPFLGRGAIGGDPTLYCGKQTPYIQFVVVISDGVDVEDDGSKMESGEDVYGMYVIAIICIKGIPVPIPLPIFGESVDVEYDVTNNFDAAKVYQMKDGLSGARFEPSSLAIVTVKDSIIPWYPHMGLKPSELAPGSSVRAFSRAKAYFRGFDESGTKYQKPHTSYPFWGAKLAGLGDETGANATITVYKKNPALTPDY